MSALVSVVMPCFNAETYLAEAIESILGQSHRNLEFIIVDDGSTDGTPALLDAMRDPRIRVLRNERNLGVVESLNRGFAEARGEFIARMDADDVALPERLAVQVARFLQDPQLAVLGTAVSYMDASGKDLRSPRIPPESDVCIRWRLLFSNCLHHPTVMFRRASVSAPVYSSEFPDIEDWELWFRLGKSLKFAVVPQRLLRHRRHSGSVSGQRQVRQREAVGRLLQRHVSASLGVQLSFEDALALYHPPEWLSGEQRPSKCPVRTMLELRAPFMAANPGIGAEELQSIDTDIGFFVLRCAAMASSTSAARFDRRVAMLLNAAAVLVRRPASAIRAVSNWSASR